MGCSKYVRLVRPFDFGIIFITSVNVIDFTINFKTSILLLIGLDLISLRCDFVRGIIDRIRVDFLPVKSFGRFGIDKVTGIILDERDTFEDDPIFLSKKQGFMNFAEKSTE